MELFNPVFLPEKYLNFGCQEPTFSFHRKKIIFDVGFIPILQKKNHENCNKLTSA